jgi:hypothetical protein
VRGTVVPDTQLRAEQRDRWVQRHALGEGYPCVHGANLGVRTDLYRAPAGFADYLRTRRQMPCCPES